MGRTRLLLHGRVSAGGGGGAGPTLSFDTPPIFSGEPMVGKSAEIYAGDVSGGTVTSYRFTVYRDGVQVGSPTTQTSARYRFDWASADKDTVPSATVEANNGTTWTSPQTAALEFEYPSDVILDSTMPVLTLTRTSTSPLNFDLAGNLRTAHLLEIEMWTAGFASLRYRGRTGISEAALLSPWTPDLTGATDPAPSPAMPAFSTTNIVRFRAVTPNFNPSTSAAQTTGAAGPWVSVSDVDFSGSPIWTFEVDSTADSAAAVIGEIELALATSGQNIAPRANWTLVSGTADPRTELLLDAEHNEGGTRLGDFGKLVAPFPAKLVLDWGGVNVALKELRLNNQGSWGFVLQDIYRNEMPINFKFGHSNSAGTYPGTAEVVVTGQTWSTSGDELKTYSIP
jgi:hypothetical protein